MALEVLSLIVLGSKIVVSFPFKHSAAQALFHVSWTVTL